MKVIPLLCFRTLPLACRPLKWTWKVRRRSPSALSPGCRAHLEVTFLLQSVIDLFSDFDECYLFFFFFLSCTTPEANTDRNTPLSPGVLHFGVFPLVFKATARFVFHINGVISIFPFYCLTLWKPASFFPFQRRRECQGWWRQRSQAPAVLPARLAPPLTWQTGGFYK